MLNVRFGSINTSLCKVDNTLFSEIMDDSVESDLMRFTPAPSLDGLHIACRMIRKTVQCLKMLFRKDFHRRIRILY